MTQPTVNQLPRTIGFDLGAKASAYCVLGGAGTEIDSGSIRMSPKRVRQFFTEQPCSRVIIEASGSSRWTAKIGMELGHEVIIANPRKLHHITKSYTKSDGNDAFRLADLGQVRPRLLSPVRLRSDEAHYGRMHQRVRAQLVETRTALVNCVRGWARSLGHALPTCSTKVFSKRARAALPAQALTILTPLLEQLETLGEHQAECDRQTERLGQDVLPAASILRQVAGGGLVLRGSRMSTVRGISVVSPWRSKAVTNPMTACGTLIPTSARSGSPIGGAFPSR